MILWHMLLSNTTQSLFCRVPLFCCMSLAPWLCRLTIIPSKKHPQKSNQPSLLEIAFAIAVYVVIVVVVTWAGKNNAPIGLTDGPSKINSADSSTIYQNKRHSEARTEAQLLLYDIVYCSFLQQLPPLTKNSLYLLLCYSKTTHCRLLFIYDWKISSSMS